MASAHAAAAAAAAANSLQSCLTLCDPIDGSPPGSPIPGILQARTMEWVAISFSNTWKWKVKVKLLSHVWLFVTPWTAAFQAPPSMGFSRQEYWSGVPSPASVHSKCQFVVDRGNNASEWDLPKIIDSSPIPMYSSFSIFFLNWGIVALQWCVSFCCTTKWISHMFMYIYSLLKLPPTLLAHPSWSSQSTELSSLGYTAAFHFTHGSVWMSIPMSHLTLLPCPMSTCPLILLCVYSWPAFVFVPVPFF